MGESLLAELREQICSSGPVSFFAFMDRALYHPRYGYYATRVPGHRCHYRTLPSATPWFGRFVARELHRMWEALGEPDPFWVLEVGAGRGDLAADAMDAVGPLAGVLRWRFVERFDRVRELQRRRLGAAAPSTQWSVALDEPSGLIGCVLANEVLDNFPVHVFEASGSADVREVYVDVDGDRLVERLGPPCEAGLAEVAQLAAGHFSRPTRFEVSTGLGAWCRDAARALDRGYLLVIDYGDVEPELWLENPWGTVTIYGPSDLGSSPLEDPGRKDITVKVNFSALERAASSAGFHPQPLTSQRDWLLTLGLPHVAEELELEGFRAALAGWLEHATLLEGELRSLLELGAVGGVGDHLVFRAAKGV